MCVTVTYIMKTLYFVFSEYLTLLLFIFQFDGINCLAQKHKPHILLTQSKKKIFLNLKNKTVNKKNMEFTIITICMN